MQQVFIWHGVHFASFSMLASQALGLSVGGLTGFNLCVTTTVFIVSLICFEKCK